MNWLFTLDAEILLWIQAHLRKEFLTPIMLFLTNLGNAGWFWLTLLAILLLFPKYKKAALTGIIAVVIGFLITNLCLKNIVARTRPYELIEGLTYLGIKPHDFSFPSGHATCSIAASVALYKCLPKKAGIPLLTLAILICFTRLYAGVHYPTDVLAGILIGSASAALALYIQKRWQTKNKDKKAAA